MPTTTETADLLRNFVQEIGRQKQATDGVGTTTFPQDSVDDGTKDSTTGSRASENEKDVKESVPGQAVDETPDASPSENDQDRLQPGIGAKQSETGGDPAAEDNYKDTKDDPGTTFKAKADDGEKYAKWSLEKQLAALTKVGNSLLADIAVEAKQAGTGKSRQTPAAKAAAAGYAAAAAAGTNPNDVAASTVAGTLKEASHMADLTYEYLVAYANHLKQADEADGDGPPPADGESGGEAKYRPEESGHGDGGPSPDQGGGGGGDILAQMMGGGGGDAGAPPPDAPPSHDEAMQGLNGAMDDMQLTPELIQQLIQLLQAQGGGAGGGMPPGAGGGMPPGAGGGMPPGAGGGMPPDAGGMPGGMKAANVLKTAHAQARKYRAQGKYEQGPPKTARVRKFRNDFRNYLTEIGRASGHDLFN